MSIRSATTLNLASLLDHQARLIPNHEALVFDAMRMTYAALAGEVSRVAAALRRMGIRAGDHVALTCPNLPYFPLVYFGILRVGGVVVPLNVLLKSREIAYHLRDSDAVAYFCFEGTPELPMAAWGKAAAEEAPDCRDFVVVTKNPGANASLVGDVTTLHALLANETSGAPVVARSGDDTAVILYTSGTTGQPKGAELTHANLWHNAMAMAMGFQSFIDPAPDARNVALVTLPLFHSFGQVVQMLTQLMCGGTLVLHPTFDPARVLETMRKERVNLWAAVPTMVWTLLKYITERGEDPSSLKDHLRLIMTGGSAMPVELLHQCERQLGIRVLEGYGLSETSPVATCSHVVRQSVPGSVGQAIGGVEVACVDDEDQSVPVGETGEVVIRGHNIMKGYYKRPDATAEAFRNGWFHSGDIGRLDADGNLFIVDRKKDMIIRGGLNVYPREIEEILMTHPAVSLCAVVGIPDERLGEEVKAFVVKRLGATITEAELVAWCREELAAFKYPRVVEFSDSLPMGATGKVLKRELRRVQPPT